MRSPIASTLLICSSLVLLSPVAAEREMGVTQEIVRMLDAGVSEEIIVSWLETNGIEPELLTSDELIALTAAGASDQLISSLIARSTTDIASPPEAEEIPPESPADEPAAAPAPAEAIETWSAPTIDVDRAQVDFDLKFEPWVDDGDLDESWNLFVYVDGEYLARLDGGRGRTRRFSREMASGPHRMAFLLERHIPLSGKKRAWQHESRVLPEVMTFDLPPGGRSSLKVRWREPWHEKKHEGPIEFQLALQDEVLSSEKRFGTPWSSWPTLCEDVEANRLANGKLPAGMSGALKNCLSWLDLWGQPLVGSRDEILQVLASDGLLATTSR